MENFIDFMMEKFVGPALMLLAIFMTAMMVLGTLAFVVVELSGSHPKCLEAGTFQEKTE